METLLVVGVLLMVFGLLGGYFVVAYPAEYRAMAPDGTQIMLECGNQVCRAPIISLKDGLDADKIIINNRSAIFVRILKGDEDQNVTTTTTVLPDGTTVTVINDNTIPQRAEEPVPSNDNDLAALSIIINPKPGQRVEIEVANKTYYVVYDEEGRVISTNIVDLPGPFSTVSEDAESAIITYVAAPFIAGFVFTFASFGVGAIKRH